jgi:hypothetical protein
MTIRTRVFFPSLRGGRRPTKQSQRRSFARLRLAQNDRRFIEHTRKKEEPVAECEPVVVRALRKRSKSCLAVAREGLWREGVRAITATEVTASATEIFRTSATPGHSESTELYIAIPRAHYRKYCCSVSAGKPALTLLVAKELTNATTESSTVVDLVPSVSTRSPELCIIHCRSFGIPHNSDQGIFPLLRSFGLVTDVTSSRSTTVLRWSMCETFLSPPYQTRLGSWAQLRL